MNALPPRLEFIRKLTAPGQEFELVEVPIRGARCRVFRLGPGTVADLLSNAARNFAAFTYLVYEGERFTFAETAQRVASLAGILRSRYGVRPGDRVAISMRNYPEWIFSCLAAFSMGGIAVALNAWWSADELEYALKDCGARVLIADQERIDSIASRLETLGIRAISVRCGKQSTYPHVDAMESILANEQPAAGIEAHIHPDDDALIMYTSGSTGHPKGVVSTHRNLVHAVWSWKLDATAGWMRNGLPQPKEPFEKQYSQLLSIPLFHVTGCHVGMLLSLVYGRKLVLMYKWDVQRAIDLIQREQITYFSSVSTVTGDLVRAARESGHRLETLLNVGGGGAPRPPAQTKEIPQRFPNAVPSIGWGMTETNSIGTGISGPELLEFPRTSGYCSAVLDMKIVDDNGQTLGPNLDGELLVRGTSMFRTYWNRPEATREAFSDGWFRTGDVGHFDAAGRLFIVDRIKDIVIRGGENISCAHVEAAIYECPPVAEAVVLGVPDSRLGEELAAVVVRRPGQSLDESTLIRNLSSTLGKYELPRYIILRDEALPRIASGKMDRRALRNHIVQQLGLGPDAT